jgi:hypothetical protein
VEVKAAKLKRGDTVRLKGSREVGVVVHTWWDRIVGQDCWVAFFGLELPGPSEGEKPYVLRYSAHSLKLIRRAG